MERSSGGNPSPNSAALTSIHIYPAALSDIESAVSWYESQRPGLGTEFILELDHSVERASANPNAFVKIYRIFRRALLRRFPYALYFSDESDTLYIHAVLHQHRSTEFTSSRLK